MRQGRAPFIAANREQRETIPKELGPAFDELVQAERDADDLLMIRNEFRVLEAQCLLETGQRAEGINRMYAALEEVDPLRQVALWKSARDALWGAIGYR